MIRQPLDVVIHDAHLGIWQDAARDETYYTDVFKQLVNGFGKRKWRVTADPKNSKRHRCLSKYHRLVSKGDLRAEISCSGRHIEVNFWAETWPIDNRSGRRYDFNKLQRMNYLDRLRVELERRRILAWLETLAPVTVKRDVKLSLPALDRIELDYAASWHTDKALGRPNWHSDSNRTSRDKGLIEHKATVWFLDNKARVLRGTAYYRLNNMWSVVVGKWGLYHLSCHEIFVTPPSDLRKRHNERARRGRLEGELAAAVRRMDYRRAEVLKNITFGPEQTYLIWANDHSAYYGANYCGYTSDTIAAGKYTREEAEREVRRVPHELVMVCPDGTRLDAQAVAA